MPTRSSSSTSATVTTSTSFELTCVMPGSHQSSLLNVTEWVSHWQGLPIWYDSGPIKNDFHQTHGMNKMWCWKKGWTSFYRFRIKFLIFSLPISILTGGARWCCWWGCTAPPSSSSSSCSSCPSPTSSASTPSLGEPISYFDTNENPIFLYERRSDYIHRKFLIQTNISINVRIKNILD